VTNFRRGERVKGCHGPGQWESVCGVVQWPTCWRILVKPFLWSLTAVAMGARNAAVRKLGIPDLTTTVLTLTNYWHRCGLFDRERQQPEIGKKGWSGRPQCFFWRRVRCSSYKLLGLGSLVACHRDLHLVQCGVASRICARPIRCHGETRLFRGLCLTSQNATTVQTTVEERGITVSHTLASRRGCEM